MVLLTISNFSVSVSHIQNFRHERRRGLPTWLLHVFIVVKPDHCGGCKFPLIYGDHHWFVYQHLLQLFTALMVSMCTCVKSENQNMQATILKTSNTYMLTGLPTKQRTVHNNNTSATTIALFCVRLAGWSQRRCNWTAHSLRQCFF